MAVPSYRHRANCDARARRRNLTYARSGRQVGRAQLPSVRSPTMNEKRWPRLAVTEQKRQPRPKCKSRSIRTAPSKGARSSPPKLKVWWRRPLTDFSDRVTRVEVHLSDVNGDKRGEDDKRCMMEVRLEGRQPTAVTHQATTLEQAVAGAAGKVKRSVEHTLDRESTLRGLRDHR